MSRIEWQGAVTIAAPAERVYAYLADFPRHAEWAQSVVELREIRPGDARGIGRRFQTAERQSWQANRAPRQPLHAGVKGSTVCEVRELIPNRRIAWRAWVPIPGIDHRADFAFDLEALDSGQTRLSQTALLSDRGLAVLVTRLVFKQSPEKAKRQWAASLNNIKAILEEGADSSRDQPAARSAAATR